EYIWKLDHMITSQSFAKETREGIRRIGERLLILGNELYSSYFLSEYMNKVNKKKCYGHPAIVFTMMAYHLNIPKSTAVLSYLFSSITSIIQNSIRGIPLGQTEGQQLIKECQPIVKECLKMIDKLTEEDFGITLPGVEISQMRHENLNIRIFMS
ncbi:MAG: urease accessory protein UreF, partial [Clostridiales bacterium]|nr:urease accessory protein UreF [Clostridiales bacterium]